MRPTPNSGIDLTALTLTEKHLDVHLPKSYLPG
jgi:hypothetical protein